jgi:hypothetical protein
MVIPAFILTFNRPKELHRLVENLNIQGFPVYILNNYPKPLMQAEWDDSHIITNYLNSPESNSWCARSWNTLFQKAFDSGEYDRAIFIQDDTDIGPNFKEWIEDYHHNYDFIWGPAGDQFFYMTFDVFKAVGWFDERYIGCYCGDADFMKRIYLTWQKNRISVVDTHNWGFRHNDIGLQKHVITTYESKTFSGEYLNQHWDFEKRGIATVRHSQKHYFNKWGHDLDCNMPCVNFPRMLMHEIDWYPWFSKKHNFNNLYDRFLDGTIDNKP